MSSTRERAATSDVLGAWSRRCSNVRRKGADYVGACMICGEGDDRCSILANEPEPVISNRCGCDNSAGSGADRIQAYLEALGLWEDWKSGPVAAPRKAKAGPQKAKPERVVPRPEDLPGQLERASMRKLAAFTGNGPPVIPSAVFAYYRTPADKEERKPYLHKTRHEREGKKSYRIWRPSPRGFVQGIKGGWHRLEPRSGIWQNRKKGPGPGDAETSWMELGETEVDLFNGHMLDTWREALAKDAPGPIWLCAGEKDADAVTGLGAFGVSHYAGEGAPLASHMLADLRGLPVGILYDADDKGREGAQRVALQLTPTASDVRICNVLHVAEIDEGQEPQGFDLSDAVALLRDDGESDGHIRQRLLEAWDDGERPEIQESNREDAPGPPDPRPVVYVGADEARVNDEALAALAESEERLFCRNGRLVEIAVDTPPRNAMRRKVKGSPRISELAPERLREMLAARVSFRGKPNKKTPEGMHKHPPVWCVNSLMKRPAFPELRRLVGISESPILRPDGSICETPGYDPLTGYVYRPAQDFEPVIENPSPEQIRECLARILGLVVDFPFPDESHRSGWLALVLTLACRTAIDAPCPLFLADGSTPAAGKGLSLDAAAMLVTGRDIGKRGWPQDTAEQSKVITATLIEGHAAALWDNVTGNIGGSEIDRLLTADSYTGRILGQSRTIEIPNRIVWCATGNNLSLGRDTVRRTVLIRIQPDVERPELRTDFTIKGDLLQHVARERGRLLPDVLTLLRAFFVTCRPHERPDSLLAEMESDGWTRIGSFFWWSLIVRGCLRWLGQKDPWLSQESILASSPELEDSREVVEALADYLNDSPRQAVTAKEIFEGISKHAASPVEERLRAALEAVTSGPLNTRRIGCALRSRLGGVMDGRRIATRGKRQRAILWTVEGATPA